MRASGVPHRATSTVRNQPGSFHHIGLAVDFAGPTPGRNTPELRAVYEALLPLAPIAKELFYGGAGGGLWRDGRRFNSTELRAGHLDHVHVAVPKGWRYQEKPLMPDDPSIPNLNGGLFGFYPLVDSAGKCQGYIFVSKTGEIHGFGPGWTYYGRSEIST